MADETAAKERMICGLVMPISPSDDAHSETHWKHVRKVLEAAIENAGLTPKPVWDSTASDIIQAKILTNLLENELVVCDLSTRNPNVMFELGIRLATKKPTVVVAEQGTPLPFDTNVIHTEFYPPSLTWENTTAFIDKLAETLRQTVTASKGGSYRPYLEHFVIETAKPGEVTLGVEELLIRRFDVLDAAVHEIRKQVDPTERFLDLLAAQSGKIKANDLLAFANDEAPATHLSLGQAVHHAKFGVGTVVAIEGHKIDVDFEGGVGRKRVIDSFVTT